MSYETNKHEWLMGSSPHGNFIMKGNRLVPYRMSKKTLCRLRYLARKNKISYRWFLIKAILQGHKSV